MCITSEDSFYILRFDRDAYNTALDSGADLGDEGVEEAFDMVAEVPEPYVVFKPDILATNLIQHQCQDLKVDWRLLHLHQCRKPT